MLFYERRLPEHLQRRHSELLATPTPSPTNEDKTETEEQPKVEKVNINKSDLTTADIADSVKAEPEQVTPIKNDVENLQEDKQTEEQDETEQKGGRGMDQITANCDNLKSNSKETQASTSKAAVVVEAKVSNKLQQFRPLLSKELEDWIWQDNRQFLQDRNIFEHTYFKWVYKYFQQPTVVLSLLF